MRGEDDRQTVSQSAPISPGVQGGFAQIVYHAGIILKSDVNQFKRLLFRTTKGKVLTKICDNFVINYNVDGSPQGSKSKQNSSAEKCVYVLVFQDGSVLKHKVMRICDSFSPDNKRYQLPKDGQATQGEYRDEVVKIQTEIQNLLQVINMSASQLRQYLEQALEIPGFDRSANNNKKVSYI